MAHIAIIGVGIGGLPMAFEMREIARPEDRGTVVANTTTFHFVPSNPWVAVDWRKREEIELEIAPLLANRKIDFDPAGVKRVFPEENGLEVGDGRRLDYNFLVIATGPKLAFDEIEGLGRLGHPQSICHVDHALQAKGEWETPRNVNRFSHDR